MYTSMYQPLPTVYLPVYPKSKATNYKDILNFLNLSCQINVRGKSMVIRSFLTLHLVVFDAVWTDALPVDVMVRVEHLNFVCSCYFFVPMYPFHLNLFLFAVCFRCFCC